MAQNVIERMAANNTDYKIAVFHQKQSLPYEAKVAHAEKRAREFYNEITGRGDSVHVSVGGLDSITLFLFLRSIGLNVPAISASSLEDKSIQAIHEKLGIIPVKPLKSKVEVLREFGYPILSKETAGKIALLQNPSEKNATVRHAIMTGETGEYGGNRKGTRMKMSQKWLEKFGGTENERYGTNYQIAKFKVSDKCCYYLKEKPCDNWAKENKSFPYLGLMATEHGRREKSLMINGCNYYSSGHTRSAPFAIFSRQDLLQLVLDLHENPIVKVILYECGLETFIPEIYGTIECDTDGTLSTTGAQRTGCSMCGFGIHLEYRPHRFDRLRERDLDEWKFWMYTKGWGDVLSYVDVGWEEMPHEVIKAIIAAASSEPKGTVKQRADRIIKAAKKAKISMDYLLAQFDTIEDLPSEVQDEIIIKIKRNTCRKQSDSLKPCS